VHSVSVNLDPALFLASWREKAGTIFLPALSESRVGDQVAVRVGIYGHAIRATLFGKVALVRCVGRPALPPGIELQLEKNSLAAAGFLAAAARGEPISFKERAPRYQVERTLAVERGKRAFEITTLNVSDGGLAARWPGPLPLVGDALTVRLKDGLFGSGLEAIVCWNQPGAERERTVGLKVQLEGRGGRAWRRLVEAAARSGARTA
jgi:Tfp pilus assembly protein PilZ